MRNWIDSFVKKTSTKEVACTSISVILTIVVIRTLGLLQPLEWTAFDLLFFLRPAEPKDERIVIVAWDEADLQMSEEGTMSDHTLAVILERIKKQQPRIIGLDLFRDVPVLSKSLSAQQNEQAYHKLQAIFRSTPNLVGIETVIPPTINPPKTLKDQGQTTAADLLLDRDGIIRRAYIHPLEDEKGEPAEIPALGVVLGYQYLAQEGFEADKIEGNALQLANSQTGSEIILQPFQQLDGGYVEDEEGTLIFVNWRKGNPRFDQVFVSEVAAGLIPPGIFKDKIVLIGNISASGADKHHLPINRWTLPPTTNGVEIHAQIASYIISAALDGRPLIKTIPEWSEWVMLILTVVGIALIAEKYRPIRPWKIIFITATGALVIICGLGAIAWLTFAEGYWIPIVPSLLGALATPMMICLTIYVNQLKAANEDFRALLRDLNHSIKNPLSSIQGNVELAHEICQILDDARSNSDDFTFIEQLERLEQELAQPPLSNLRKNLERIQAQAAQIERVRNSSQEYFSVAYSGEQVLRKVPIALNELIQETVRRTFALKTLEYNCNVKIQEDYGANIPTVNFDRGSLERIIENLIDNAFCAIYERMNKTPEHQGLIRIQTQKKRNKIEISITDNGSGIHSSIVKEIFSPFKSFKSSTRKGQGLGLALAQKILHKHNGDIRVETQEGQGSKFIVSLPSNPR